MSMAETSPVSFTIFEASKAKSPAPNPKSATFMPCAIPSCDPTDCGCKNSFSCEDIYKFYHRINKIKRNAVDSVQSLSSKSKIIIRLNSNYRSNVVVWRDFHD